MDEERFIVGGHKLLAITSSILICSLMSFVCSAVA